MSHTTPKEKLTATATELRQTLSRKRVPGPVVGGVSALLAVGIAGVHIMDQGGIPGSKTPLYIGWGYYVLEIVAIFLALALVFKRCRSRAVTWLAAGAVAVGPLAGYILSRGPGLPAYTDDRGNWAEPIGLLSLALEGLLLMLTIGAAGTLTSAGNATAEN